MDDTIITMYVRSHPLCSTLVCFKKLYVFTYAAGKFHLVYKTSEFSMVHVYSIFSITIDTHIHTHHQG